MDYEDTYQGMMDETRATCAQLRKRLAALEVEYATTANDYAAYTTQSQARFAELTAERDAAREENARLRTLLANMTAERDDYLRITEELKRLYTRRRA